MTADDIYAIAGDGTSGYTGTAGRRPRPSSRRSARVPRRRGDLVIADSYNAAVRFVPATGTYYGQSMTADHIYTIAGDGTAGYSGNGGPATSAELTDYVGDATVDAAGNLFIADTDNDVIRFVPETTGTYFGQSMTADDIYTIAGAGWCTVSPPATAVLRSTASSAGRFRSPPTARAGSTSPTAPPSGCAMSAWATLGPRRHHHLHLRHRWRTDRRHLARRQPLRGQRGQLHHGQHLQRRR